MLPGMTRASTDVRRLATAGLLLGIFLAALEAALLIGEAAITQGGAALANGLQRAFLLGLALVVVAWGLWEGTSTRRAEQAGTD